MGCIHCGAKKPKWRKRSFDRVGVRYLICTSCGRAQRRPSLLKVTGRGIRTVEREKLRKSLKVAAAKIRFNVLVWGPSPTSGNSAAEKRKQIRDELRRMGHNSFYSEDLTVPGVPTNVLELAQVGHAELVINVAASPGSLAEFENYGYLLGKRHLIFVSEETRGGFMDTGTRKTFRAAGGDDEFYQNDDLSSCVLTLVAADWIEAKTYYEMQLKAVAKQSKAQSLLRSR